AVRPFLSAFRESPNPVRQEAARLCTTLGLKEAAPMLREWFQDRTRPTAVRLEALRALAVLDDGQLATALPLAVGDADAGIRVEGFRLHARTNPTEAVPRLRRVLEQGTPEERRGVLTLLGEVSGPAADLELVRWLDKLEAGEVPAEIQL